MPHQFWIFVGALAATFLLRRLFLFILKRWGRNYRTVTLANGASGAAAVVLAGYGAANGGPWAGGEAALIYIPAQCVWLAVDLWRVYRPDQPKPESPP